jgi:hypothetical protein
MKLESSVRISWLLCFAVSFLPGAFSDTKANAQDNDKFEGAVWKFTMTPKQRGLETLNGAYRISNDVLYQKKMRSDRDFALVVGNNNPQGTRTRVVFENFRAFTKSRVMYAGLKGTAVLRMDALGEWSGVLTDEHGRNWDFKCSRVQE